ncbi:MAG TPA: glycosyltransferase [Bacteroidales bacterium]|mgnify:CR=1 FL=1|nr:glycosyltransferase [Bacteroidales bacterium]
MEKTKNLLVALADKNYIDQAKQLFSSAYWNAGWNGDYMLLAHDIPEGKLKWFHEKGILVKHCKPLIKKKLNCPLPPVVFDKLYLFTEEFKKWRTIVFLDSDMIVKAPIDELTKIKYFGVTRDIYFNKLKSQLFDPTNNQYNNITYDINVPAFNSGVISFNTDIITPDTFSELLHLLKITSEYKYGEQPVLNLYFYEKWEELPSVYNVVVNYHGTKTQKKIKSIILHFAACHGEVRYSLWDPKNHYYNEWKTNLEKADLMDLNNIPIIAKWSRFKTNFYSTINNIDFLTYKNRTRFALFFKYHVKPVLFYIIKTPDRLIGLTGLVIKIISPGLYYVLKGQEDIDVFTDEPVENSKPN